MIWVTWVTIQEGFKNHLIIFIKIIFWFQNILNFIIKAIQDATTASNQVATEASDSEAITTASSEIGDEAADALGELDDLNDMFGWF